MYLIKYPQVSEHDGRGEYDQDANADKCNCERHDGEDLVNSRRRLHLAIVAGHIHIAQVEVVATLNLCAVRMRLFVALQKHT